MIGRRCERWGFGLLVVLTAVGAAPAAFACQVPVFRYALERWEPDLYDAYVLHRGALAEESRALVAALRERTADADREGGGWANLQVHEVDLDEGVPPVLTSFEGGFDELELPALFLLAPQGRGPATAVLAEPLDAGLVATLTDSPLRREITQRILSGDSVVWVLVECPDAAKNDAAFATLTKSLGTLEKELRLPDLESIVSDAEFMPNNQVELKLAFSALRLAHGDAKEAALREMLLSVEPDLRTLTADPMAFPVFGRGRALYALVAGGINESTIGEACAGLIGPCSCTVKDLNPGADLIFDVAWNDRIVGSAIPERPLPALPGLAALSGSAATEAGEAGEESASAEAPLATKVTPAAAALIDGHDEDDGGDAPLAATTPPVPPRAPAEPVADVRSISAQAPAATSQRPTGGEEGAREVVAIEEHATWSRLALLAIVAGVVLAVLAVGSILILRERVR